MSPMDIDGAHPVSSDWKLLSETKLEFADVNVLKWRSESTGLKVVWADVEGQSS